MNLLYSHIFGVLLACLMAGSAFAEHLTPRMGGVDDARYFAAICMKTAPSFSEAKDEEIRWKNSGPASIHTPWSAKLLLEETETSCYCRVATVLHDLYLKDHLHNLYVILKRDFAREFQSGNQEPIRMKFEFGGEMAEVAVPTVKRSDKTWFVIRQITREGNCPQ